MDDLISRQAAIDVCLKGKTEGLPATNVACDCCAERIRVLPSAQQWIPCSERLPEEDGLYLVTTSKGQVQMHVFSHYGNSEEYWTRCNKAWMPLPEPYREEQE